MGVNVNKVGLATFFAAGALAGIRACSWHPHQPDAADWQHVHGQGLHGVRERRAGQPQTARCSRRSCWPVETACSVLIGTSLAPVGTFLFMLVFLLLRPQGLPQFLTEKA